jgi:hypothetical protein
VILNSPRWCVSSWWSSGIPRNSRLLTVTSEAKTCHSRSSNRFGRLQRRPTAFGTRQFMLIFFAAVREVNKKLRPGRADSGIRGRSPSRVFHPSGLFRCLCSEGESAGETRKGAAHLRSGTPPSELPIHNEDARIGFSCPNFCCDHPGGDLTRSMTNSNAL